VPRFILFISNSPKDIGLSFTSEIDSYYYPLQLVKKKKKTGREEKKIKTIISLPWDT